MYGQIFKLDKTKNKCQVLGEDGIHYPSWIRAEELPYVSNGSLVRIAIKPAKNSQTMLAEIRTVLKPDGGCSVDELERFKTWSQEATRADEHSFFVRTSSTEAVLSQDKLFVLGRKGSGKTALGEYLRLSGRYIADTYSFENFPFPVLYKLEASYGNSRIRYVTVWQILFLTLALATLARSNKVNAESRVKIERYLNTLSGSPRTSKLFQWINKPFIKLSGQTVAAVTGVDPAAVLNTFLNSLEGYLSRNSSATSENPLVTQLENLKSFYSALEKKPEVLIIFDELDEEYVESNVSIGSAFADTLRGLFTAAIEIHSLNFGIKPLVLLREDIYESFQSANKGKLTDYILRLDWGTDELREVVAHRLAKIFGWPQNISFDKSWLRMFQPFYSEPNKDPIASTECFFNHTTRTPRDCVVLLKIIAEYLMNNTARRYCDSSVFLAAREMFGEYYFQQLIDAIHPKFEDIENIFLSLRQNIHSPVLERDHLIQIFSSMGRGESELNEFLFALYEQAAIGLVTASTRVRAKYFNDSYLPKIGDKVILHPALAVKLGLEVPMSGHMAIP